ncbi:MAG: YqgE/AlgH family protein [Bacteroidales bacterium]|nr:YqgE/AlgH family protein [Bacteroidales bacterium]
MSLDYDFFSISPELTTPQKGKVLISEPFIGDQYFKRSVVLLTEHSKEGSVGFVLNKPVDIKVKEVIKGFPNIEAVVSMGGPVGTDTIHYLHTLGEIIPDSVHVFEDLYWGGNFETVKDMLETGLISDHKIRFFVGYSGWGPKQLEREISEDSWVITQIPPIRIMENRSSDSWKEALVQLGKKYKLWANFPDNPDLN